MPGLVLHAGATILCLHGGQAQPTAPFTRVRVGGQPIVVQPVPHTVVGCPFNAGGAASPCVAAQWISAAARLMAGGQPVLLQDSQAVCAPNGTGVTVLSTQARVRGQ